jgi:hypothetical protein
MLGFIFGAQPDANLISPLPIGECKERLTKAVDPPWMLFGGKPVLGSLRAGTLVAGKRIFYGNSFRTMMRARLSESGATTRIHCSFGMPAFTTIFMTVWFGLLFLIGGMMMIGAIFVAVTGGEQRESLGPLGLLMLFFAPPLMFGFGVGLVHIGQRATRGHRQYLIDFMRETLEANAA